MATSARTTCPVHFWLPALVGSTGGIQAYMLSFLDAYNRARSGTPAATVFIKNDRASPTGKLPAGFVYRTYGGWRAGPLRTLVFAVRLLWAAWRERPGLIVVGHVNFAPLAEWAHRFLGIPFWAVVYGIDVTDPSARLRVARLLQAERVIAISRYTRDFLIRERGLDPARFSLLPTTFDDQRFQPGPPPGHLREQLGLPPGCPVILTVCRLSRAEGYKGYDQILRALPAVRQRVPAAHYVLGGRGDDLPRIEALVRELDLDGAVTLPGFIPEDDLVAYYRLCDVFAMPSRNEGFGIVFLEALACGRIVLAGNRDGSVDAVLDGELGLLVDPEDTEGIAASLIALLTDENTHPLARRPDELHARIAAAYGPARFAATLTEILDKFLPPAARGPVR